MMYFLDKKIRAGVVSRDEKEFADVLSDTLTNELQRYAIGPRIRALRLRKKLGLVQLGDHTGLSPAMLSKIERGQIFPTLPTLLRIAMVFGVGLDHFFAADKEKPLVAVVRKEQRLRLPGAARRRAARPVCSKAWTIRSPTAAWRRSMPSSRSTRRPRIAPSMAARSSSTC